MLVAEEVVDGDEAEDVPQKKLVLGGVNVLEGPGGSLPIDLEAILVF